MKKSNWPALKTVLLSELSSAEAFKFFFKYAVMFVTLSFLIANFALSHFMQQEREAYKLAYALEAKFATDLEKLDCKAPTLPVQDKGDCNFAKYDIKSTSTLVEVADKAVKWSQVFAWLLFSFSGICYLFYLRGKYPDFWPLKSAKTTDSVASSVEEIQK